MLLDITKYYEFISKFKNKLSNVVFVRKFYKICKSTYQPSPRKKQPINLALGKINLST